MSHPLRLAAVLILLGAAAFAHPMGNFSVSHYARLEAQPNGVGLTYILDLAELPTFELLQKWELKQDSPKAWLDAKAAAEAREWVRNLKLTLDGKPVVAKVLDTQLVMANGAGNLPIARVTTHLTVPSVGGTLEYEDGNYAERAGWKEIVIGAAKGATVIESSQIGVERSKALTEYPADPTVAPPQELRARLQWKGAPAVVTETKTVPVEQPKPVPAETAAPAVAVGGPPAAKSSGEVVKGDALSNLLSKKDLTLATVLIGLAMAFWFGALHATTPGHGKTMVAAYLVGERGTAKHALLLGAIVTLTHTMSVFAMGIAAYFLAGSFAADKVTYFLQVVSGLMIVVVGLWLLYKRSMKLMNAGQQAHTHSHHPHTHTHTHDHHHHEQKAVEVATVGAPAAAVGLKLVHSHDHGHADGEHNHHDHDHPHHDHDHAHRHDHSHAHAHDHHHGPGGHSHVPEGPVTMGSLLALGASGGLVPCPSALILLLSAVSIGRIGFGLALLVSFSLGLAVVLMAIGLAVLYAKQLLPQTKGTINHPIVKLMPIISAVFVTCIGIAMTLVALGVIRVGAV